ncbi:hypothetical protein VTK56DRAFT_1381 [Thermocarpiscus australiensis]
MSVTAMDAFRDDPLVQSVTAYVKDYMKNYDASHSWDHIERVVNMAHFIYARSEATFRSSLDLRTIHLAALLHDVGDRKYLQPHESPTTQVESLLRAHGADPALAAKIQTICLGVSYSSEVAEPEHVASLIRSHPELAVVQDADRLDAVGAVGIARMFTFGGARMPGRDLRGTMGHLDEKLLRLEGMMKTAVGREVARDRGERLRVFRGWWEEEVGFGGGEGEGV